MKLKLSFTNTQPDFFQAELKSIINLHHPSVKLAEEFKGDAVGQQLHPSYYTVTGAPDINAQRSFAAWPPCQSFVFFHRTRHFPLASLGA